MSKQLKSQARNSYFYPRHNFLHHTFKQLPNMQHTSKNLHVVSPASFPVTLEDPQPKAAKCKWAGPSCLMVHAQSRLRWRWWLAAARCHPRIRVVHQKTVNDVYMVGFMNIVGHVWGWQSSSANQLFKWASLCTCMSKAGQPSQQTHMFTI